MNQMQQLLERLDEIISLEGTESIEKLGGYTVGELLGDHDSEYSGLYESNAKVQRIGDLASDLERSNGTSSQLQTIWNEIKQLVVLKSHYPK